MQFARHPKNLQVAKLRSDPMIAVCKDGAVMIIVLTGRERGEHTQIFKQLFAPTL